VATETSAQGTVWTFDAQLGSGSVLLDDGTSRSFDGAVFAASGLRLLRPGQRVRLDLVDDEITSLTILTLDSPH
jgi:cold shock CspA family protein